MEHIENSESRAKVQEFRVIKVHSSNQNEKDKTAGGVTLI